MQSLVGLRAIDVTKLLARDGYFELGSYGKPIALVVALPENKSELAKLYRLLEKLLNEKQTA